MGGVSQQSESGESRELKPAEDGKYYISTAEQLREFAELVNDGETTANAELTENINLSSVCSEEKGTFWTPIGTSSKPYTGTFNGNDKTISNLYIDTNVTTTSYQGLFGYVGTGGTVQNLSVSGSVTVTGDSRTSYIYVGGIVGYNKSGTITDCTNEADVSSTGDVIGSTGYVGGIVGFNNSGTVTDCTNEADVTSSDDYVGGIVGWSTKNFSVQTAPVITGCTNNGTVNATGISGYVGGIAGTASDGTLTGCTNNADVTVTDPGSNNNVGGIAGSVSSNTIVTGCINNADVTVSGSNNYVGGIVGYNNTTCSVENCYNTGTVTSSNETYVGSAVGYNASGSSVTNCYYMKDTASKGIGDGDGTKVEEKTAEQFSSGEVAYLLQKEQTAAVEGGAIPQVWGQNIVEDKSPVLTSDPEKTVYQVTINLNDSDSTENETRYTNSDLQALTPTREGYTFGGWYADKDCTDGPVITITATTSTLYAKWTAVEDPDPEPTPEPEPEEPPYSGKYSYEISTDIGDNGALTVDRYATEGDTVTPDDAYKLDDLTVTAHGKDVELTANSDGTYTFTMPSADVRITATFAEDPDWTEPEPEPSTDVSDLFIDVAPNAWYKDAVQYAYDNGLMTGVSDTEFAPEATTTRAMIVSILARLEGVERAEAAGFADVNDEWYATAVNWAANVGVVNGYEDNTFRPNQPITREQLAAILMNYANYKGQDVSNRADLTTYTDQPSTWAEETMSWAVAEGLISGVTNTELQPQGNATRAQVAAILQRFLCK